MWGSYVLVKMNSEFLYSSQNIIVSYPLLRDGGWSIFFLLSVGWLTILASVYLMDIFVSIVDMTWPEQKRMTKKFQLGYGNINSYDINNSYWHNHVFYIKHVFANGCIYFLVDFRFMNIKTGAIKIVLHMKAVCIYKKYILWMANICNLSEVFGRAVDQAVSSMRLGETSVFKTKSDDSKEGMSEYRTKRRVSIYIFFIS